MQFDWQFFRFPLDDEGWQRKAITGGLVALIGMVVFPLMWPVMGYGIRVMRRTIADGAPSLPEWDDWGELFMDGLRFWGVSLVYTLPVVLPLLCAAPVFFLIFPALFISEDPTSGLAVIVPAVTVISCLSSLTLPLSLALSFLSQVAVTRMVARDSFGSAFEFREVWQLARAGFNNFIVAYLMWYIALIAVSMAGSFLAATIILSCLYPVFLALLTVYSPVLAGALFGTAYHLTQADPSPAG